MGSDQIARGGGPENTSYDKMRHESMRLRPHGMYGIIKIGVGAELVPFPGTCEKCVFDRGTHSADCQRLT